MNRQILEEIRCGGFSFPGLVQEYSELAALKEIPQDQEYHGEGDVYCHTEMVCEKLKILPGWQALDAEEQALLFLAAAFHDMGKAVCTKQEDGRWVSPRHTIAGEKIFREKVFKEPERFGLTFSQRERVAKLIRYHGLPVWFWTRQHPEADLLRAAESIPLRVLYLLSLADVSGRITSAPGQLAESVELFADYVKELKVWDGPCDFANPWTRFRYFQKEDMRPDARLYDDTEFDVVLMCGLPLSGKDSWIYRNGGDLPVISMDRVREGFKIPPARESGRVAHIALEEARSFLRRKESFIWNATDIIQDTRQKLIRLFAGYGARVRILYVETPYQELLRRNQVRERYIPEHVLEGMIRKLEPPAPWEAYKVKNVNGAARDFVEL